MTTIVSWNNPRNPLDVNDNGVVTALDALLVINALNTRFQLPPTLPDPFDPVQYWMSIPTESLHLWTRY